MAIEQVLKDLGAATAYAYAVEKGYTGTEAEFAELMASYASVAQSAAASATAAAGSATSAASSASTASAAATTATTKASEASTSATNAAGSASSAASSATAASGSATSAAASATTASGKASEAATAATTATTAKTDAVAAKTAAETAQTAAETAQGKAETAQGAAEDAAESVSASAAQIATNTSDISDLKEDLLNEGVSYTYLLSNDFFYQSRRMNCHYGNFDYGTLKITALPDGFRAGLQGYIKSDYSGSYTYNSGWIVSVPFEVEINPDLYYMVQVVKNDFSDVNDVSIPNNGFAMYHNYSVGNRVDQLVLEDTDIRTNYMPKISSTIRTIGHRGDTINAPECTAPAYIMARNHGITVVENDTNFSSDEKLVMWHDTTLESLGDLVDINGYEIYTDGIDLYYYDANNSILYTYNSDYEESSVDVSSLTRCNGLSYSVSTLTLAQLKRIDFGVYKGSQFKGTQILTFDEWILLCKQIGCEAYIDFKIGVYEPQISEMFDAVIKYGMLNEVTWINLSTAREIELVRSKDANARIATFENPTSSNITTYAQYNTGRGFVFDGNGRTLTQANAELALKAGFSVECYYVEYASTTKERIFADIQQLVSFGISGITLDHYRVDEVFASMFAQYH